tara:strand:+ start:417 stop:1088 length:672 start_codon:yes stop_codon:yes gene_type:complete
MPYIVTADDTTESINLFVDGGGVTTFNTRRGGVVSEAGDYTTAQVAEQTNLYYTNARVEANSAVALNTAKTSITPTQASDIATNTAKVGITPTQASDITSNNTKISYTDASAVSLNTAKVGITPTQANKLSQFSGGRTEVDFGTLPVYEKEFTITDTNAIATSNITASLAYEAPTSKELDEIEMDMLSISCGQSLAGSFKMFIKSIDGSYLADKFKINYSITI